MFLSGVLIVGLGMFFQKAILGSSYFLPPTLF